MKFINFLEIGECAIHSDFKGGALNFVRVLHTLLLYSRINFETSEKIHAIVVMAPVGWGP